MVHDCIEDAPFYAVGRITNTLRMKHGLAVETCRLPCVEAVVLVDGEVEFRRDIAAPLVIATDPVRVPGLNSAQEVAAHQITAIVCLAISLQLTVGQRDRLQQCRTTPGVAAPPRVAVAPEGGAAASGRLWPADRDRLSLGFGRPPPESQRSRSHLQRQARIGVWSQSLHHLLRGIAARYRLNLGFFIPTSWGLARCRSAPHAATADVQSSSLVTRDRSMRRTTQLPATGGHPFYQRLNQVLDAHAFDEFVEVQCAPFYADTLGRPSLTPGAYCRLLLIGTSKGSAEALYARNVLLDELEVALAELPEEQRRMKRRRFSELQSHPEPDVARAAVGGTARAENRHEVAARHAPVRVRRLRRVRDAETLYPELQPRPTLERKSPEQGHVVVEEPRPAELVAAGVAAAPLRDVGKRARIVRTVYRARCRPASTRRPGLRSADSRAGPAHCCWR